MVPNGIFNTYIIFYRLFNVIFAFSSVRNCDLFKLFKAKANCLSESLINVVKTLCDGRGQWSEVVLPRETRVGGNRVPSRKTKRATMVREMVKNYFPVATIYRTRAIKYFTRLSQYNTFMCSKYVKRANNILFIINLYYINNKIWAYI